MRWLVFIFPIVLLGCRTDEVQEIKTKKLVIASDFLESSDVKLFHSWSKRSGIRIKILSISQKELTKILDSAAFNSGIDLFIGRSLYSSEKLQRKSVFQKIELDNSNYYDSKEYHFFGLGIDPYVFLPKTDSSVVPKIYSDLTSQRFHSDLERTDEIPFLAGFLSKMDRVKTYNWLKNYQAHKDSLHNSEFTLTKFSRCHSEHVIEYPGKRVNGTLYDLTYIGVIRQTEHIGACRSFLSYYRNDGPNGVLCRKLQLIPLSNPDNLRLFRRKPEDLLQYYEMINRMLKKVEQKVN
jgi:hypothetical protein